MTQRIMLTVAALLLPGCAVGVGSASRQPNPPPLATAADQSVKDEPKQGSKERDSSGATAEEVIAQYGKSRVGGLGDLLVAPTRIVLDDSDRYAQLSLVNIGTATATYRISFTELEMAPSGELRTISDPAEAFMPASKLVRYSPRQIVLQPNVAQTVRLQVRRPADLPEGEYRSHLLFRAIPPPETSVEGEKEEAASSGDTTGLSVRLVPLYGITIPVIIRHGETSVSVHLTNLLLVNSPDGTLALDVEISREGNRSVYGNLEVTHHPATGPSRVVGAINGLGVYTPLSYREARIPLRSEEGPIEGGYLEVEFRQGEGGENELLARERLVLP